MSAGLPPPSDAPARAAIEFELETNFAVEAAAGAGKTTCLVRRLLQLFRRGALADGSRLAAVTFTHKAAAELRDRLDAALALAPSAELTAAERENLAAARRALPECHVGTIHSFCARLLRERPVEAGVGPGFREMEDEEDELFRRRAWDKFAAEAMRAGDSGLIRTLAAFGLDLESLRPGFESFAAYPDVACWPGGESVPELDCAALVAGAGGYLDGLLGDPGRRELLEADGDAGTDELIPALRLLRRRLRRLSGRAGLAEALDIEALLRERPRIIDKKWRPFGADKDGVKAAYDEFYARTVLPFRQARLAQVYAVVMAAFERAAAIYDRLRRRAGRLNFQDLLLGAAKLLRDYPRVRADLARRYARLLIDETQDTDPVQAEIMFLLASDDPNETDWRRCRPRPGALFVVGDPKQSIYRFRRADIAVYQEAKRLIVAGGGRVLGLTANFRGQPEVLAWINRTFGPAAEGAAAEGRFSAAESPHGPAYAPLEPGLPSRPAGCFGGVYFLETIPVGRAAGVAAADAMADEADRIARFIRNAVDQKLPLPLKDGQKAAEPGDFLLITRNKRHTAVYAGALRRLGLACRESGGAALAGSAAARQLADYLAALAAPYDPVPALAVLRGPLFGLSDPDLYAWKKAGGAFLFSEPPPAGAADLPAGRALAVLAGHHRLFGETDPAAALGLIADSLGLWPASCLGDNPASGAGTLAAALELIRAEGAGLAGPAKLARRLAWLIRRYEAEAPPARPEEGGAARVMNVHKTKGLEAPVVFLTCYRYDRFHPARLAIRRDDGRAVGAMRLAAGPNDSIVLGQPPGWEQTAEEEERFLAHEKTRLNYVAATRAGAALVLSVYPVGKGWKSPFVPGYRHGETIAERLPEPLPAAVRGPAGGRLDRIDPEALSRLAAGRAERLSRLAAETPEIGPQLRAKPALASFPGVDAEAMDYGETLHRLLAAPRAGREELTALAADSLRESGLPVDRAGEAAGLILAIRESDLWRRALRAELVFREMPYTAPLAASAGGGLERGIIDLVFKEAGGWILVDYKSGPGPGIDCREAAREHAPQLAAYRAAWRRLTGGEVIETGVFYLHRRQYVVVDADDDSAKIV